MRVLTVLLSLALLLTSTTARAVEGKADGCVWVAESPSTKLYLCGTIHLLRPSDYPLPEVYDRAYADSQRLVFELPPGSSSNPELGKKMAEAGVLTTGQSLDQLVSEDLWQALSAWSNTRGVPVKTFATMQPWMAALTISITEYVSLGADPNRGVDHVFERRMKQDGKPGEGLESMEFQIGLFSKLSAKQQNELLEQTLAEVKTLPSQFEKMITAWRSGNADSLHQMLFEEAEKYPDLLDAFLTQRNARWIKQLEAYLAGKERIMVLVGGGHLGGEGGVIDLLRKKGYTVRKLVDVK